MDETEIIRQAKLGDQNAFSELIRLYQLRLLNFAYFHIGNRADAEDIVQETFWNVFRHIKKQKDEKRFFNWIYTIEMNIIRKHCRRKKTMNETDLDAWSEGFIFLDNGTLPPEDRLCLKSAILKLNDTEKNIVYLKYFEDYSIKELAKLLEVSEDNIKSRLYRTKKKLEKFLSGDESEKQ